MMRTHTNGEWEGFHPKTNVMWLHYLLDKLTSEISYKNKKKDLMEIEEKIKAKIPDERTVH